MARIDPHGENTMPSPCPVAGGGDQEARCLVGSVPHLRLDSCCGAHAGGRTLLLDFCGEWWISWWTSWELNGSGSMPRISQNSMDITWKWISRRATRMIPPNPIPIQWRHVQWGHFFFGQNLWQVDVGQTMGKGCLKPHLGCVGILGGQTYGGQPN